MQSNIYNKAPSVLDSAAQQIDYFLFWPNVSFKHLIQEQSSIFLSANQAAQYPSFFTKSDLPMEWIFFSLAVQNLWVVLRLISIYVVSNKNSFCKRKHIRIRNEKEV